MAIRCGLSLLLAALILATTSGGWETSSNQPIRPVGVDADVDPTLSPPNSKLAPSPAGSWSNDVVAAALLEMKATKSLRGER